MFTLSTPRVTYAGTFSYWSTAAEAVLRSEGVISIASDFVAGSTEIVTAGGRRRLTGPVVFELDGHTPSDIGPNWTPITANYLEPLMETVKERIEVRQVNTRSENGVAPAQVDGTPWDLRELKVMVPDDSWEVLLHAKTNLGSLVPIVVRKSTTIVITIPIFGLVASYFSFPALKARYAGARGRMPSATIRLIMKLLIDHHLSFGQTTVARIGRWPVGYHGCLSVRLDLDRKVDQEAVESLVALMKREALGCSVGVLDYYRPREVLDPLINAGAEIQLHTFGEDLQTVSEHLAALRLASGYDVVGATVHGGPSGIGYRGDDHLALFSDCGLFVGEVIGLQTHSPVPIVRPGLNGATWSSDFLAPPRHLSLDVTTRPDDHARDAVIQDAHSRLDKGEHVIVMNHPDIHRSELIETVRSLSSPRVWKATVRQVASWVRASRFQATATPEGDVLVGATTEATSIQLLRHNMSPEDLIVSGTMSDGRS